MDKRFPSPRPIAVDFFCGAGGMSLGFEQAGFDIVFGTDIDGYHVATHERNFPYGKSLCESIVNLDGDRIRAIIGDRDIDVVVGGPPCQGFSNMGLRDLKDPRNSLIDHYIRLVLELRPKTFVMENVPGMLAGQTRAILDTVIRTATDAGYKLTLPVRILDAADFGVPQHRRRLFVLGVREDIGDGIVYPETACLGQAPRPTVMQAIADLPVIERDPNLFRDNDTRYSSTPRSHYAKVARSLCEDPSDLSRPRIWNTDICSGCLRTDHSERSVALYAATPPGQTVPGHKLPRLHPDGLCTTLRAGSDSSHGSYTAPRPVHPVYPRCITTREAARLHGYPDWFTFYPLKWHGSRQIGNSVCPPVARAVGYAIRDVLRGRTTANVPRAIALEDTFVLPTDRPRTLKRVPQLEQFPPVIEFLFGKAFDAERRRLRKASFTFDDVQTAIKATGVNLQWVREDTFISEIARSRRVEEMLSTVTKEGYSILPQSGNCAIGKFVPLGTPGTVDDKANLHVRIDELHNAKQLPLKEFDLNGSGWGIVAILSDPCVQADFLGRENCVIGLSISENAKPRKSIHSISLRSPPDFKPRNLAVITSRVLALPNKARIARIGQDQASDDVAVFVAATSKHLVALRFENCLSHPREVSRCAFELSATASRRGKQ